MRTLLLGSLMVLALACATGGRGGKVDAARGARYYTAKCNACHPGGRQGAGPELFGTGHAPQGPLVRSSSGGRHNVPEAEWESLLLYLTDQMKGPGGAAPAAVAAVPPPPPPPVAPVPAPVAAPVAPTPGATKMCACTCQCPADTPPGQMSNCQCQCQCP